MAVYKNWAAICHLEPKNIPLMQALALADPSDGLEARLINAFPEFFCEEPVRDPVPLSVIKRAAAELSALPSCPRDENACWQAACSEFDIPIVGAWRADGDYILEDPVITAEELQDILKQLGGKPCRAGCVVEWRGRRCLMVGVSTRPGLDGDATPKALYLVPAECVSIDC
ncbi:MAG TPA: hypothetical protein PKG54_09675 [Phycisphaerae bacterium]|nr:hypothetical protein [Phycisphaerae bacterium]HOB74784.1 hypothetical protein [Phycisphaerae bacterium]HOJ54381.1 hypothetical protein [Phycisphaerae bacterium]HOL26852.1 hypothetical protein [Phycisphaerae bacterium]HPP20013.1 hypothetical protein [Phycisphaerae bacterium]